MRTKTHKRPWRAACALGGFSLLAAATFIPSAVATPAAPRPLVGTPGAEWDAATASNILGLNAVAATGAGPVADLLTGLGLTNAVADADVVTTVAEANSVGPVNSNPALRSFAEFANVGTVTVLGGTPIELLNFSQAAPPDNAAPQEGAFPPIDLPGLANIALLPGEASARWAGDSACVAADTPVARSHAGVANLSALNAVSLENAGQGAVDVTSTVSLPANPGGPGRDPRSVVGTTTAQVASIDLLDGALKIGVGSVPTLTATATGLPNGASLEYSDPVLTMSVNNGPPQPLVTGQDLLPLLIPAGSLLKPIFDLVTPIVGTTSLTINTGIIPGTEEEAADGTHASGAAALLHVNLTLAGVQIIDLAVLPMGAEANAPLGGLDCGGNNPVDIRKDASTPTVSPGDTFDYIVTVTNISDPPCPVTNATVIDTITGPAGSTIVGTDPPADSAEWPTVRWTVPGPVEPGQSIQLRITVKVPTTAQNGEDYDDEATISEGECGGVPFSPDTFLLPDIPKVVIGVLPRTGGSTDATLVLFGIAAMMSAALGLRRLRRS